jgi:hypothetical protein
MWLTAAWMGLAGLASLAIAVARPDFRLPLLAAYVVTAGVVGAYLGSRSSSTTSSTRRWRRRRRRPLNELVARTMTVATPAAARARSAPPSARTCGCARAASSRSPTRRAARRPPIELAEGGRVLRLTDFEVDNGPDLRVYMVAGPARSEAEVRDFRDLGGLKGNKGDQQYELPDDLGLGRYSAV